MNSPHFLLATLGLSIYVPLLKHNFMTPYFWYGQIVNTLKADIMISTTGPEFLFRKDLDLFQNPEFGRF